MKSIDWQNAESYRNRCIAEFMELAVNLGLNSSASEREIIIDLPTVSDIQVWPEDKKRRVFDISSWGPKGIDETTGQVAEDNNPLPDDFQMPDYGQKLEEGEPPEPPKEQE